MTWSLYGAGVAGRVFLSKHGPGLSHNWVVFVTYGYRELSVVFNMSHKGSMGFKSSVCYEVWKCLFSFHLTNGLDRWSAIQLLRPREVIESWISFWTLWPALAPNNYILGVKSACGDNLGQNRL